ncbi:MAG: ABC transporter ATP-binding protein [Lachnospiraceae bacterium]|nr:ABC transporter ATP-binding protein [Lachnospiraceae bacterium]
MIEVKNLVKEYGGHAAVNDLSFTVETGKVIGFLGPNGAGKSTTMNIITGYIAPTSGEVLINGIDVSEEPEKAKKEIGYLPEIPPLYPDLRVREYLTFVAELKKVSRADRDTTVHKIMGKTGTLDVSERLIRNLSKGYKQRVGLAAAMMGNPDILILDEPTVGLDPKQIMEMRALIRELSHHHTILLSSHIMQEIAAVCDEIIVINEGQMIAKDTPDNLTKEMVEKNGIHLVAKGSKEQVKAALRTVPGIKDVQYDEKNEKGTIGLTLYVTSGADIREDVFYAMAKADCPIYELHPLAASLEDAFLALTKGGSKQYGGKKTKKTAEKKTSKQDGGKKADEDTPESEEQKEEDE